MEMDAERWARVERLYLRVLELPPERRTAVLEESCSSDPDLLFELQSLLEAREQAGSFLSPDQLRAHIGKLGSRSAAPAIGSTVGPYEILAEIGSGAMGDVYRAWDTRLDRHLALKILPSVFTNDAGRIARFRLEAKAASALNHSNIVTIYEIGQAGETWFIAEELIEGVTLAERLSSGQLPPEEAIRIGIQCAMALETAHRAGIVHRDVKPENIMLRPDGLVKIVDFGLARIGEAGQTSPQATQAGSIMGTPRYMSPEQARGEKLDARSDIFSLGAVLYEMFTGHAAFPGKSSAEVFASLLDSRPVAAGGHGLGAVLSKALAKDRGIRYQTMRELADGLCNLDARQSQSLLVSSGQRTPPSVFKKHNSSKWYLTAALVFACAILVWRWGATRLGIGSAQESSSIVPLTTFAGSKDYVAFSPDGKRIAFSWNGGRKEADEHQIYVKPVGDGDPVQLTNSPHDDILPAWSPDGQWIAFCRRISGAENSIYIIPSRGGAERKVAVGARGVSWSPDGNWFALAKLPRPKQSGGLFLLSIKTGQTRELTAPHDANDSYPVYSPDGRWIAFTRLRADRDVFIVPSSGGRTRQLTFDSIPKLGRVTWTADSREIVYSGARENGGAGLWRVSLARGAPRRIYSTLDFAGNPAISGKGDLLAYTESWIDTNIYRSDGPGFSAGVPGSFGEPQKMIASSREDYNPSFSPDGQRIAFVSNRTGHSEIWTSRLDGSHEMQVTDLGGFVGTPRWSPDGRWIAFDSITDGNKDIWVASTGAAHSSRRLTTDPAPDTKPSWSPDGAWIYFNSDRSGSPQIWKIKSDGTQATQVTRNGGREPLCSADGKIVYYTKGFGGAPIWSVPSGGGLERPVAGMEAFDSVDRLWGVLQQGIYFISWQAGAAQQRIQFFSFPARRVATLGDWDSRERSTTPDLALSADGCHLLAVHKDQEINDLMMIQNFR